MATIKDEAICIRHWDWSETSQTVSLFTREHGLIRGLAKGARREKSPYSGGIELATRGEMVAITKSGPATGALATITAWDLSETFTPIRRSLLAFRIAMAMLDCLSRSLQEADPHPGLFDATLTALRQLGGTDTERRAALATYLLALLREIGHAPELVRDISNGAALPQSGVLIFLPQRGGFTASAPDPGGPAGPAWRTRAETLGLLQRLTARQATSAEPIELLQRATRLLGAYLEHVLESHIPSLRSLNSAGDQ